MMATEMKHVVVYRNEAEVSGWPFNGGMWQFEDGELAVGFARGPCDYERLGCTGHDTVDVEHVILRSRDGGKTWPLDTLSTVYANRFAFAEGLKKLDPSVAADEGHDPTADGFCLISGFGLPPEDAPYVAFAMVSTDRGQTWKDPTRLPLYRAPTACAQS